MMVREMRPGPVETPLTVLDIVVTCASARPVRPSVAAPIRARTRASCFRNVVVANAVAADADMANPPNRVSSIIGALPGGFPRSGENAAVGRAVPRGPTGGDPVTPLRRGKV